MPWLRWSVPALVALAARLAMLQVPAIRDLPWLSEIAPLLLGIGVALRLRTWLREPVPLGEPAENVPHLRTTEVKPITSVARGTLRVATTAALLQVGASFVFEMNWLRVVVYTTLVMGTVMLAVLAFRR